MRKKASKVPPRRGANYPESEYRPSDWDEYARRLEQMPYATAYSTGDPLQYIVALEEGRPTVSISRVLERKVQPLQKRPAPERVLWYEEGWLCLWCGEAIPETEYQGTGAPIKNHRGACQRSWNNYRKRGKTPPLPAYTRVVGRPLLDRDLPYTSKDMQRILSLADSLPNRVGLLVRPQRFAHAEDTRSYPGYPVPSLTAGDDVAKGWSAARDERDTRQPLGDRRRDGKPVPGDYYTDGVKTDDITGREYDALPGVSFPGRKGYDVYDEGATCPHIPTPLERLARMSPEDQAVLLTPEATITPKVRRGFRIPPVLFYDLAA